MDIGSTLAVALFCFAVIGFSKKFRTCSNLSESHSWLSSAETKSTSQVAVAIVRRHLAQMESIVPFGLCRRTGWEAAMLNLRERNAARLVPYGKRVEKLCHGKALRGHKDSLTGSGFPVDFSRIFLITTHDKCDCRQRAIGKVDTRQNCALVSLRCPVVTGVTVSPLTVA